jgi:hypothetical protein
MSGRNFADFCTIVGLGVALMYLGFGEPSDFWLRFFIGVIGFFYLVFGLFIYVRSFKTKKGKKNGRRKNK